MALNKEIIESLQHEIAALDQKSAALRGVLALYLTEDKPTVTIPSGTPLALIGPHPAPMSVRTVIRNVLPSEPKAGMRPYQVTEAVIKAGFVPKSPSRLPQLVSSELARMARSPNAAIKKYGKRYWMLRKEGDELV